MFGGVGQEFCEWNTACADQNSFGGWVALSKYFQPSHTNWVGGTFDLDCRELSSSAENEINFIRSIAPILNLGAIVASVEQMRTDAAFHQPAPIAAVGLSFGEGVI